MSTSNQRDVQAEQKLDRQIEAEVVVAASLDDVWTAWTTTEGISSFFAPDADIELKVGGKFELYFMPDAPVGQRGAEGTKVLSFLPKEMLSFEWSAPPAVPTLRDANMRNWVVLRFEELGPAEVKLHVTHLGWGEGEDWDACFDYFSKAWPSVLKACQDRFIQ